MPTIESHMKDSDRTQYVSWDLLRWHGNFLKLYAKGGSDGKFFGSVTSKEIAEALAEQFGIEIDKRKIVLPDALKAFGTYSVDVKLYPEIVGKLNVLIASKD